MHTHKPLADAYRFRGFTPEPVVHGVFGDPHAMVMGLKRRQKKQSATLRLLLKELLRQEAPPYAGSLRRQQGRVLGPGDPQTLVSAVSEGQARDGEVPCRQSFLHQALRLLHRQALPEPVHQRGGERIRPRLDHIVSDLERHRPIWFGGKDRSEESMNLFYQWLGPVKSRRIRLAVMDMWKPFENSATCHVPEAAILYDKFDVMRHLGEALDKVRKSEYARVSGRNRRFIKGQKYTLLSHRENL